MIDQHGKSVVLSTLKGGTQDEAIDNLALLHPDCHRQVHGLRTTVVHWVLTNSASEGPEPDAGKLARGGSEGAGDVVLLPDHLWGGFASFRWLCFREYLRTDSEQRVESQHQGERGVVRDVDIQESAWDSILLRCTPALSFIRELEGSTWPALLLIEPEKRH